MAMNQVKKIRESLLMSKAELARKAGISPLTVDRIESGAPCRLSTMRKLILAFGLRLEDREKVFPANND
jgi:DNA-binding XRE family transcriptional regulator